MRVERDFHDPQVVHRLETVDEGVLAVVLENLPREVEPLEAWQVAGIEKAIESLKMGRGIPHAQVESWVESLGSGQPLPLPR